MTLSDLRFPSWWLHDGVRLADFTICTVRTVLATLSMLKLQHQMSLVWYSTLVHIHIVHTPNLDFTRSCPQNQTALLCMSLHHVELILCTTWYVCTFVVILCHMCMCGMVAPSSSPAHYTYQDQHITHTNINDTCDWVGMTAAQNSLTGVNRQCIW